MIGQAVSKKLKDDIVVLLRQLKTFPLVITKQPKSALKNKRGVQIIGRHISYNININRKKDIKQINEAVSNFDFSDVSLGRINVLISFLELTIILNKLRKYKNY